MKITDDPGMGNEEILLINPHPTLLEIHKKTLIGKSTRQIAFKFTRPPSNPQIKLMEEPSMALEKLLRLKPSVTFQYIYNEACMPVIVKLTT